MKKVSLMAGELLVADQPTTMTTTLGSCISVCVFDQRLGIGGMIHYSLPSPQQAGSDAAVRREDNRFGTLAIPNLLREFKMRGSQRSDLVVKVLGGARIATSESPLASPPLAHLEVGQMNSEIARIILAKLGLKIAASQLGGNVGLRVEFDSWTGEVRLQRLGRQNATPPHGVAPLASATASHTGERLRVLIIDDSRPIRLMLRRIVDSSPDMVVVGEANDPYEAMELRRGGVTPDVITLDLNMPRMDGTTYLKQYMRTDPVPTLVITSYSVDESSRVLEALECGAFDHMGKPSFDEFEDYGNRVREKLVLAARSRKRLLHPSGKAPQASITAGDTTLKHCLIAIGASTGGTEALREVLTHLPANIPPILIVQHIPPVFSRALAERFNTLCPFKVKEAEDHELIVPGVAYIAPGDNHFRVRETAGQLRVVISRDERVNKFRPSVDVLFESLCQLQTKKSNMKIAASLLTGMGTDGAEGLAHLRQSGAETMAQDEATSVVFGMPKAAIALGAAMHVLPLSEMASKLADFVNRAGR